MPADTPAPVRRGPRTELLPGQIAQLTIINKDTGAQRIVYETDKLIEAPNWTPDGKWLIINGGGKLYRIAADGSEKTLKEIDTGPVQKCNNDHVLSPDGKQIYISAAGHLYVMPVEGSSNPKKISNDLPNNWRYFLHGVTPDNKTLIYTGVENVGEDTWGYVYIMTIPAAGGPDKKLTSTGRKPVDGPEYTIDGKWIYYNSEERSTTPGHAQIFRMRADGTGTEQITFDERVNWFPHFSPDGKWIVYLSYPPGTVGHPADKDVILRIMPAPSGPYRDVAAFFGGQGTINVPSWAPDSKHFAFMAYPMKNKA